MKTFKNWVKSHNPKLKWDFNNPNVLVEQLSNTIGESGHIQLKELFQIMFANNDSGLTFNQNEKFLKTKY